MLYRQCAWCRSGMGVSRYPFPDQTYAVLPLLSNIGTLHVPEGRFTWDQITHGLCGGCEAAQRYDWARRQRQQGGS